MDFSSIPGQIYFNNKFIRSDKAKVHVLTHSLHFAGSVFEGIGVYKGKPLFMSEHYERFLRSAKLIGLNPTKNIQQLKNISIKLLKKNKISNGYIRPIFFRSAHSMSPDVSKCKTLLAIAAWKWKKLYGDEGVRLNFSKWPKLNENIYPIAAKSSGSYQNSILDKMNSNKKGYHDCVTLDLNNKIAETTACNIFWIKNNVIFTPNSHSILNGITRRAIIKIAKKSKFKIKIGNFHKSHLLNADSAFVTGTATEIQPVKVINSKSFNTKSKIINLLKEKYELLKTQAPEFIKDI